MSKHGRDVSLTEGERRALVLLAYHDATCPDHQTCSDREQHSSNLRPTYPVLAGFLERLSELEAEVVLDAV